MMKWLKYFQKTLTRHHDPCDSLTVASQIGLICQYRQLAKDGSPKLPLRDIGFRVYSQHEEDGILLYIFSLIGTTNKTCVEICAGDGIECNTANLIINHKWNGLLCDGKEENIKKARRFYSSCRDTTIWPPTIVHQWITAENVNDVLAKNDFVGNIDLFSLDVDGNDYWLWKSVSAISPRVVVLEFNHLLGPEKSATIPYDENFKAIFTEHGSDYAGASLAAFVKLGRMKGYHLVGTNTFATNAFFLRNDTHHPMLQEISPKDCFDHPRAKFGMTVRWAKVKDRQWIEV